MDIGLCSKCLGRFCLNARDQTHISTSCVYREIYVYSNNPWLVTIEIPVFVTTSAVCKCNKNVS